MCHSARSRRSVEKHWASAWSWPADASIDTRSARSRSWASEPHAGGLARPAPDPTLRIGDAERDVTAAALAEHHAVGRLDFAELEDRLEAVQRARTAADLADVVRDLPGGDAPGRPATVRPARPQLRGMGGAIAAFVVVIGFLWVVWAMTGADFPWPIFPMVAWGAGLASRWQESAPDRMQPDAVETVTPSATGGPRT